MMKGLRNVALSCFFGSLLNFAASGAEIALVPVSADGSYLISGNEIILDGGGQRVFFELFLSDWDPDLDGVPLLKVWQTSIDSAGYSSGTSGVIAPAVEACSSDTDCVAAFGVGSRCIDAGGTACAAGFQDETRPDYVFFGIGHIPGVDIFTLDYRYGGAIVFPPFLPDSGTPRYGGTLVLDVPVGAMGTFNVILKPTPDSFMQDENSDLLPVTVTNGLVTIKCQNSGDCADGNACTTDTCNMSTGACSNSPNYNPNTDCCDPNSGVLEPLEDGNDCTNDVCDLQTGAVAHLPFAPDTSCGDPTDTECNPADTCDGAGSCQDNLAPTNTPCGDSGSSECNGPDTCDGAGECDPNFAPIDTACGDPPDTDCTDPDSCDGSGTCLANNAPDTTPCDDAAFCTDGENCVSGTCGGGSVHECDDGIPCTGDTCNESTDQCDHDLALETCLIDGSCYPNGDLDPGNDCQECNNALSTTSWSFSPNGATCDDGDACSGTGRPGIGVDACDGAGTCFGTPDPECNDDCEFAVEVSEGTNTGNNDDRGPDDAEASCQLDSNNDVWFVYTAACDGLVFMSTTGSQFTPSNDPVLTVYDSCPSTGGAELACDDDSGLDLQAALTFTATAGANYRIRVAGFEDNSGDIVLNIEPVDDCLIDGACYPDGAINPSNECEACVADVSSMSWSPRPEGSGCGNAEDTECDSPDACDGAGICESNPKPDGTECSDDGNECTFDACLGGSCNHPPRPSETPCGDPTDTECDHPDTCDGDSYCQDNLEPLGGSCGDATDSQCDHPDICNGVGACDDNLETDGTTCDDGDVCTGEDSCESGQCAGAAIPIAPQVEAVGSRRLAVTPLPAGAPSPVALHLTSPDWPCLSKYISPAGLLLNDPVFQVPDDWGDIIVLDQDIVPSSTYVVEAECGSFTSAPGSAMTALWGDVVGDFIDGAWTPPNGVVNFNDISASVDAFRHLPEAPPEDWIDIYPCTPDGVIDFMDITMVVDAFRGLPYPCAVPCGR